LFCLFFAKCKMRYLMVKFHIAIAILLLLLNHVDRSIGAAADSRSSSSRKRRRRPFQFPQNKQRLKRGLIESNNEPRIAESDTTTSKRRRNQQLVIDARMGGGKSGKMNDSNGMMGSIPTISIPVSPRPPSKNKRDSKKSAPTRYPTSIPIIREPTLSPTNTAKEASYYYYGYYDTPPPATIITDLPTTQNPTQNPTTIPTQNPTAAPTTSPTEVYYYYDDADLTPAPISPAPMSFAPAFILPTEVPTTIIAGDEDICHVCGSTNREVGAPDAVFEYPGQPAVQCQVLVDAGLQGWIPPDACPSLPSLIDDICDCKESMATDIDNCSCSVCGIGQEVTNGDAIVTLDTKTGRGSMVTCSTLQTAAQDCIFPLNECKPLQELVYEDCGCQPIISTIPTRNNKHLHHVSSFHFRQKEEEQDEN